MTRARTIPFKLPFTHYADQGYHPVPVVWGDKRPAGGNGWNTREYDYAELDRGQYSVGMLCDNVVAFDIDVDDAKLAGVIERAIRKHLKLPKDTPVRVGQAPKRMLIARVAKPVKSWDIRGDKSTLFQLLGQGKQFVVHGIHPTTGKDYTISRPLPAWNELSLVTDEQLDTLKHALVETFAKHDIEVTATQSSKFSRGVSGWSHKYTWTKAGMEQAWEALEGLDPDMPRPQWIAVGMAVHDGTHGSDEGLEMWDAWSSMGEKYLAGDCEKQWRTFKPGGNVTKATLFKNDFPTRSAAVEEEVEEEEIEEDDAPFFTTAAELLRADYKPKREFIENFMQVGDLLFHGPGKKGKSWLLLDACDHISRGAEFMGRRVRKGKVLFIGAEDAAGRFQSRLRLMGIAPSENLIFMDRRQLRRWGERYAPEETEEYAGGWTPEALVYALHEQVGMDVLVLDTQEVVEMELNIAHGEKGDSLTRKDYRSTSVYDDLANELNINITLVAHWGAIKTNVYMAATNPHEMINTTKTKIAGAGTSATLGPLANQELNDDSGMMQFSVMGKDLTSGSTYEAIQRGEGMRHTLLGTAQDVALRDTLQQVMSQLEAMQQGDAYVTSSDLAAGLDMRADTLRKKMQTIRQHASKQGHDHVFWKDRRLESSSSGYRLV